MSQVEKRQVDVTANTKQAEKSLKDLEKQAKKLYAEARKATDPAAFKEKTKAYREVREQARKYKDELYGVNRAFTGLKKEIRSFGMIALGAMGLQELTGQIGNVIRRNAELSDSFADVRKTTGLTMDEVRMLNEELSGIRTRTSRQELLALARDAGKLGIQGRQNILQFVESANQIQTALGEDLGEGAIKNIGKLNGLLKLNEVYGYGEAMLKTGSAINSLGASSLAAEGFLVELMQRIAGVAKGMNIAMPDALGLSAAVDNLGLKAEASGTAIQSFLTSMATDTQKFAELAGVSFEEFSRIMSEDANEAMLMVLEGVTANNASLGTMSKRLEGVGVTGERGAAVFLALSQNVKLLREQQEIANREFEKGTSITEEYNLKNENLAANLARLQKWFAGLFQNNAVTSGLSKLIGGMVDLVDPAKDVSQEFFRQKQAVDNLESALNPLLSRYQLLQGKTKRNREEQEELDKIIVQIGEHVPTAVTEWDKYGNAIGVNTEKAKEFLKQQQAMLQVKNKEEIQKQEESLANLERRINATAKALNNYNEEGELVRQQMIGNAADKDFRMVDVRLTTEEIQELREELSGLQQERLGTETLIKDLKGIKPEIEEVEEEFVDLTKLTIAELRALNTEAALQEIERRREVAEVAKQAEQEKLEAVRKRLEAQERIEQEYQDRTQNEFRDSLSNLEGYYTEQRTLVKQAYADGTISQQEYGQQLVELESGRLESMLTLYKDYQQSTAGIEEEMADKKVEASERATELEYRNHMALLARKVLATKEGTQERFDAEKELAEAHFEHELEQMDLTEEEKMLKREEWALMWDERLEEIEDERLARLAAKIQEYGNIVAGFLNNISTIAANNEQKELERAEAVHQRQLAMMDEQKAKKLAQLDSQLQKGIITEEQYNQKRDALNNEYAKRAAQRERKLEQEKKEIALKQAKRERDIASFQAVVNTAAAVVKALAAAPPPANFIMAAISAAAGAAEIAAIRSAPLPKLAKGGKWINPVAGVPQAGQLHGDGGIKMVDGKTGQMLGEWERGEPYMVLSRSTYANNKELVDSLLYNSMHRGGAPVDMLQQPAKFDFGGIFDSLQVPKYATGGATTPAPSREVASPGAGTQEMLEVLRQNTAVSAQLLARLSQPLHSYVVYEDIEEAGQRLNGARNGASF